MRIATRVALGIVCATMLAYAADATWVRVRLAAHRAPTRQVEVDVTLAVPLKNGRVGLMPTEPETRTCVRALFPQIGLPPCWYLQRHAHQEIEF